MNKKIYSLSELMNELVTTEGILGTFSVDANMAETSTSQPKSKCKGKEKKKKKKDFTKQDGKQIALRVTNKGKKTKGKCLVQNPTDSWFVKSGCTNHICNSLQGFQETKKLNEGELFLNYFG